METLNLCSVISNTDLTEGKGRTIHLGYFRSRSLAEQVVVDPRYSRYCVMGVQSSTDRTYLVSEQNFAIFDSVEDFFSNTVDERKRRALAKLTPEEIKLLGINV